jgi:hypothetical protein
VGRLTRGESALIQEARIMNWRRISLVIPLLCLLTGPSPAQPGLSSPLTHTSMCDASAAVAVGADQFVVANDEDNVLRVYRTDQPGGPVASFVMDPFLGVEPEHPEADIEGAARIGDRIYWITSHGRNKDGKKRPNRRRFFATEVRQSGDRITLAGVGTPYRDLLKDLEEDPDLDEFKLDKAAERAPEDEDGLNIEGLVATPHGQLLIGFRNPIRQGRALLVPLENPDEVIRGRRARLGKPFALELVKRGVRSIEFWPAERQYLIVAGAYDDRLDFQLYRWSADPDDAPERVRGVDFGDLHPEALFFALQGDRVRMQVLSDDGGRMVDGRECKDLAEGRQSFRSARVTP